MTSPSKVQGVQDLIPRYQAKYGTNYPNDPALGSLAGKPIDYVPDLPVTYWGFRLMIGFGALAALAALASLWLIRGGRFPTGPAGSPGIALLAHRHSLPGQQFRLDLHRDGPPAVGGGAQSDRRGRCVAVHRAGRVGGRDRR